MKTDCKTYKLLEIIEMPVDTNVHMINGKDYKINKNGELVSQNGDKLPISKNNIDNFEFTLIEEKRNYNFRVYKNDKLIRSFNQTNLTNQDVEKLICELSEKYDETVSLGIPSSSIKYTMSRYYINIEVEEILNDKSI
jgi:hypothetical protein